MAEEVYGFDKESYKRVVRAVRAAEETIYGNNLGGIQYRDKDIIFARVTSVSSGNAAWEEVKRTSAGAWEARDNGLTGTTTEHEMFDPNGGIPSVGSVYVCKRVIIVNETGHESIWAIISGISGAVGEFQHMVYQMVTQNEVGFEFVQAHALP